MKGSDPATYELIQKIQLLQKRVLEQSEKTVKLEAQLQESESLCRKLRELLARQPDPGEAAIRLQETQCLLRNKDKKMKVCHFVIVVEVVGQPRLFMSSQLTHVHAHTHTHTFKMASLKTSNWNLYD
jgi:hypothetical protein